MIAVSTVNSWCRGNAWNRVFSVGVDSKKVDWWTAIFLLMEGWHERIWEKTRGVIHSYSFKLKDWDTRAWDHAWVNRIALFLRKWFLLHFDKRESFWGVT